MQQRGRRDRGIDGDAVLQEGGQRETSAPAWEQAKHALSGLRNVEEEQEEEQEEEEEEEEVGSLNRRWVEEAEKAQRLREWRGRVRKARKEEEVEELVAAGEVRLATAAGRD